MQKSPTGVARALAAFGAAWTRMRKGARAMAESEAEAGVASAVAEVAGADDVIVKIAQSLPDEKRIEIAAQRKSLTARLMRLRRWTGSDARDRGDEKGDKGEAQR